MGLLRTPLQPDLVAVPTVAEAEAWIRRMRDTIREIDMKTPITVGMHAPRSVPFNPRH
jgi:hypothetical protein